MVVLVMLAVFVIFAVVVVREPADEKVGGEAHQPADQR